MNIIEYDNSYDESIKDLLVELQEYIVTLDWEKYNVLTDEYREVYFEKTMEEIKKYEGKMFLAMEDGNLVGLIVGLINNEEENTYHFQAPKRGRVTELVVFQKCRSHGVGKQLLEEMERYFQSVGCQAVLIDVFAYNETAQCFYKRNGYSPRNIEFMKQV